MRDLLHFDVIARWLLLPVLAVQGIVVRARTPILPEAIGPRSGMAGKGPPLRVLILGDSSGAGVGVTHQSEALSGQLVDALSANFKVTWVLIAKSGATTLDAQRMLAQVTERTFDVAVLALGVNDAIRITPLKIWQQRQNTLRQTLRNEFGVTDVFVTAVPPLEVFPALPKLLRWVLGSHARRMDDILLDDLKHEHATHHVNIDMPFDPSAMARDGYHPSAKTYARWGMDVAATIFKQVRKISK